MTVPVMEFGGPPAEFPTNRKRWVGAVAAASVLLTVASALLALR